MYVPEGMCGGQIRGSHHSTRSLAVSLPETVVMQSGSHTIWETT